MVAQAPDRERAAKRHLPGGSGDEGKVVEIRPSGEQRGHLRWVSDSDNEDFLEYSFFRLLTLCGGRTPHPMRGATDSGGARRAMIAMKPRDELEGMLIGQLIARCAATATSLVERRAGGPCGPT